MNPTAYSMTTNDIYDLLTDAISAVIAKDWSIVQLNVQFLGDGQDIECEGTYLTPAGDVEPILAEFPEEMIEALQKLYVIQRNEGRPQANLLEINLTAQGTFTADFSWDQEIQDEDQHFNNGGTAREWIEIRKAKYGETDR